MTNKNSLPHALPTEMGVEPAALLKVLDAVAEKQIGLHGMTILRHGHIIAEGWWAPYSPDYLHMLFSLSKSFTSTAIGFAIQEGLLQLSDPVIRFFPDKLPSRPCENMEKLTVRNLLTMATGHQTEPASVLHAEDWVFDFLRSYIGDEPGSCFLYNTPATYMLSAIIQKVTGMNTGDYLSPRLFEPLGIENWWWEACPAGIHMGGIGLNLTTSDIAKFGQFLLQKGMWNGKQLLNSAWIEEATGFQIQNGGERDWGMGYGYQFWRCEPESVYRGDGAYGQLCVVLPKQDMVIAVNAGLDDMQAELDVFWEHLLPGIHEGVLPADTAAQEELSRRLASLRRNPPEGMEHCETARLVSGTTYELSENLLGIKTLCLSFGEKTELTLNINDLTTTLPIGYDDWITSHIDEGRNIPSDVSSFLRGQFSCAGAWVGGEYQAVLQRTATPFGIHIRVCYDENAIVLDLEVDLALNGPRKLHIIGRRISEQ